MCGSCFGHRVLGLPEGGSVCKSLSSDVEAMGPRKKASKLQPVGHSVEGELLLKASEPKDYINELSHEVLCHVFRYAASYAPETSAYYQYTIHLPLQKCKNRIIIDVSSENMVAEMFQFI